MMQPAITIAGTRVKPGQQTTISVPVARLYTHTEMAMPVHVTHGRREGPRLFVSGAIHGDEIIGTEIIRRLMKLKRLRSIRGTLLAVPVVNVYGFLQHSRYSPDRRDLNRFFPGSEKGSLTSQLAGTVMEEVIQGCTHGIDLHAGSNHRANLPQIRAAIDDPETLRLARAFKVPVIINARLREGSLRHAAAELGMSTGAVKVAIHRLRKSFRDAVRVEIAETVTDPDEIAEELRYLVECFFHSIKRFRRIATRYDKTATCYYGFLLLACAMQWV